MKGRGPGGRRRPAFPQDMISSEDIHWGWGKQGDKMQQRKIQRTEWVSRVRCLCVNRVGAS
jgi:hypothetical protein